MLLDLRLDLLLLGASFFAECGEGVAEVGDLCAGEASHSGDVAEDSEFDCGAEFSSLSGGVDAFDATVFGRLHARDQASLLEAIDESGDVGRVAAE